ncbi:unnamed protein product [Linum trigynum]|uniref:Ribonuclease H1 N-terminal domain-containing protein n=1 Tax=Linum trigynum TaxID=586398 RepID=A0AAV2DB54_9ROSI
MEGIIKQMQHQQQQKKEQRALEVQLSQRRGELDQIRTTITILQTQLKSTTQTQTVLQQQAIQSPPTEKSIQLEKNIPLSSTKWSDMVEEDEKIEEDERKSKKGKWYVIYDGPFRGLYNKWAIVSHHVTGYNIKHQSFSTKEEAEQALRESYKAIAMKQKTESVTPQQRLVMKIPSISIKDIPTTKQKEEFIRPTLQKFQQCWEDLLNYKEIHTTTGFYPTFKGGPRAVIITDKIAPTTLFALHQYGLIDTIYTQKAHIFEEFPTKFKTIVKRYLDSFAKGREIYLRYTSSYLGYQR